MAPDPYQRYLEQADQLFAAGEAVKAGQIWQAILKQSHDHAAARDGLLKVRIWLQAQADKAKEQEPVEATPSAAPSMEGMPEAPTSTPMPASAPDPEPEAAPALVAAMPEPEVEAEAETQVTAPPVAVAAEAAKPSEDDLDRMLREGATLYDMGQIEDALKKWESLLRLAPDHAITREYVEGARRELGLPPLNGSIPAEAPAAAAPVATEVSQEAIEEAEKLLREGCLLWDMGLNDDAILKWRKALSVAPHRQDIQQFLDNAEKENTTETQALVAPPVATQALPQGGLPHAMPEFPATAPPSENDEAVHQKLLQAEHLIGLQRFDEAAYTLQQALRLAPNDPRIRETLARCQPPSASSVSMTTSLVSGQAPAAPKKPAPIAIAVEMDEAAFESTHPGNKQPVAEAVQPPSALTRAAAPLREGLKLQAPKALEQLQSMPWLKDPKVWAIAGGAVLLLVLGGYVVHGMNKDAQLKSDVEAARAAALRQAAAEAEVPKLAFTREAAANEAQEALSEDPVRAYLLTQYLLKQSPGDARAAQLRGKALGAMSQGGVAGASVDEFQKHLAEGNLDAAHQVMDALLRLKPDDQDLHLRAARLERALAEDHAAQGHFNEAKLDLQRARALMPEDPAWAGRLRLLEQLRSMSKAQRLAWTPLLG